MPGDIAAYYEVVFDTPLTNSFTYSGDDAGWAAPGRRAVADLGAVERVGYIIGESGKPPDFLSHNKIRKIRRVVDKDALFGEREIELAKWIADYYLCSHGEALGAMIPSGRREARVPAFGGDGLDGAETEGITLSGEQQNALDAIASGDVGHYYLYGITGSGKTEVFLRAAERVINAGKSVIYLVPEISLTHQASEVIVRRFGPEAAMLHSGMTASERLSQWRRCFSGEARIVVGPRSAVFAPLPNVGLIIIDEEHDGSFKSGNTPRYHARQVAMRRCATAGAALVMGSATPSAEAWKLMEDGRIRKLTLTARLAGGAIPVIRPVSLEHCSGCITPELQEEIRQTYLAGRQTILFLNRRGFAYFYHCKDCGFELRCKRCSVSLTWHKAKGKAVCHYCGYEAPPPASCPECGSLEAGFMGIGTEMVEEETRRLFPELRIKRVDADSLSGESGLEETLSFFRAGAIDILLGTQMVAKGLNFPGVRLVGVIFADTGLYLPDFRAAERTFSLLVQVSGRAGRFFPDGKVLVQTLRPYDPVIQAACNLDVSGFFTAELENRRLQGFPPYSRIIRVVARGRDMHRTNAAIARFFEILRDFMPQGAEALGPAECPVGLIAGNFRRQLILRGGDMGTLHAAVRETAKAWKKSKDGKVYLEIDVDPAQLL